MKVFSFKYIPKFDVRVITLEALLLGLYLVLSLVTIDLSESLRITFSFLALAVSCYYFGFWPNVIFAIAADFFGYIIHPTGAYMPLFALVGIVNALIYSFFFFFKKKIGWGTVLLAKSVQVIISNLLLNPLILQIMYQTSFTALFLSRLTKNIIQLPIDVVLLYLILKLAERMLVQRRWLLAIKNKALKVEKNQ